MEDGGWRMAIRSIGSEAKQSFAAVRAQAELGHEEVSILHPPSSILNPQSSILDPQSSNPALILLVLSNAVDGLVHFICHVAGEPILHEESILAAVFVIGSQDANCSKSL